MNSTKWDGPFCTHNVSHMSVCGRGVFLVYNIGLGYRLPVCHCTSNSKGSRPDDKSAMFSEVRPQSQLPLVIVIFISIRTVTSTVQPRVSVVQDTSYKTIVHDGPESSRTLVRTARSTDEGNLSEDEILEIVAGHNDYRRQEGASDMEYMTWNAELARMATDYVRQCVGSHSSFERRGYNISYSSVGENLQYTSSGRNVSAALVMWYREKADYDYDTRNCTPGRMCGHYTQLVWAKSKEIGCGITMCSNFSRDGNVVNNIWFFGCNYGPRGNYQGAAPYKKGPVCTECTSGQMWCKMGLCYHECPDTDPGCLTKAEVQFGAMINLLGNVSTWSLAWRALQSQIPASVNLYCRDNPKLCCGKDASQGSGPFLTSSQLVLGSGYPYSGPGRGVTFVVLVLARHDPQNTFCQYDAGDPKTGAYISREIVYNGIMYDKTRLAEVLGACCDLPLLTLGPSPVTGDLNGMAVWQQALLGLGVVLGAFSVFPKLLFRCRRRKKSVTYVLNQVVNISEPEKPSQEKKIGQQSSICDKDMDCGSIVKAHSRKFGDPLYLSSLNTPFHSLPYKA